MTIMCLEVLANTTMAAILPYINVSNQHFVCLKHTHSGARQVYLGWNRSPAQAGCMRQVLGAGALGRPRGIRWRGRWERGSGWGILVNPWLIHVNVWQKPLQYCKVISLQLIKIDGKNNKIKREISQIN